MTALRFRIASYVNPENAKHKGNEENQSLAGGSLTPIFVFFPAAGVERCRLDARATQQAKEAAQLGCLFVNCASELLRTS